MTLTANTSWSPWKTTGNTFGQATESALLIFLQWKEQDVNQIQIDIYISSK